MSDSSLHQRGWFSILTAIAMAVAAWWAWMNFEAQRRYADVVSLATSLQRKYPANTEVIRSLHAKALSMVAARECRSDLLSAGLTVILADLDVEDFARNPADRESYLKSADGFLVHMLGCTPTDGDAWARLAMVRQALGAPTEEVADLLDKSGKYAPAEGATLAARLAVWRLARDATLLTGETMLNHDIVTALTYYGTQDATRSLAGGSEGFRAEVVTASRTLPAKRVLELRKAGLDIPPPNGE